MAIAAVLCFFPVFVNLARGLRSVRPTQLELMRSYAAGEFTVFRRVRIPTALPFLFVDFFGAALTSLSAQIKNDPSQVQYERAWSEILVASILGLALYLAIVVVERLTTRWQPRQDSQ